MVQATNDRIEGFLTFYARKGRTEAKMSSIPECEMTVVDAGDIKAIGITKSFGVPVGRGHNSHHGLALAYRSATQLHIFRSQTSRVLTWTLVSEHLFNCRRDERTI